MSKPQVAALQDENGALRTKIEVLEEESVKKVKRYTKFGRKIWRNFSQEARSLELGKRLNILREQFGREQAASLEETYKQSREEGEEEESGERRDENKYGGHEADIKHSDNEKDETEGDDNVQAKKVGHVNESLINEVSPAESEMDQDLRAHQKSETGLKSMSFIEKDSSQIDNSLAISGSTSKLDGGNQKEGNSSQMILIQNPPEKSSEKNLQAMDESQYPLPDTGSKANLDFVTLKAQPTFPRNTKYSKEAKSAWKRIMTGKERKMPEAEEDSEEELSRPTNGLIAANVDATNTNGGNIKLNLNKGEHMLRSLGSARNIRKKLPIRTT